VLIGSANGGHCTGTVLAGVGWEALIPRNRGGVLREYP